MKKYSAAIFSVFLLLGILPTLSQGATTATFDTRIPALPAGAKVAPSCPSGFMPSFDEEANNSSQTFTCVPMPQAANTLVPAEILEKAPVETETETETQIPVALQPVPVVSIGAGGIILGKSKMGCYADQNKEGKTWIMPFFEENTGEWIESDHYGMKHAVGEADVYMVCTTSADGLTTMFVAQGYAPTFFSAKWF